MELHPTIGCDEAKELKFWNRKGKSQVLRRLQKQKEPKYGKSYQSPAPDKHWGFWKLFDHTLFLLKLLKFPYYLNMDSFNSQSNPNLPIDFTNSNGSNSAPAGQETSEEPTMDSVIDEELQDLGVNLMDQNTLERQIMIKVWPETHSFICELHYAKLC